VSNELRLELDLWFEPRLGRIGADDNLFFRRFDEAGGRIVWCDEATVHETVLPERLSRRWLLRRAFRGGQSHVLVLWFTGHFVAAGLSVATGLLAFPGFLALGLVAYPFRPALGFRLLRRAAVQIGKVAILTPFRYREYEPKP
jgi:succinoglycan biosynthesis protein ExoM